ncbi:auxin-responsive protein IAA1 [Senna tora]|uniref:Auxin-induced protein n=1 Tax=Senna tora TaxID=362788 RepID=A0A834T2Y1_9FABA|nr:auxin-responsive protein IAA1 [Senna tora]
MSGPENQAHHDDVVEVKLTLGLPGAKAGTKRGFSETVDLPSGRSDGNNNNSLVSAKSGAPKGSETVGWPPVRAARRRNVMKRCKYVKVAVDGAPYLRKVDLEVYGSYEDLMKALETMFSCITIRNDLNERKVIVMESGKNINGSVEYMPTYEDKDGDWMMVGDVPWKMFVESCKRIRLMISSDANTGLDPRTASR